jgi:hypothetical protein
VVAAQLLAPVRGLLDLVAKALDGEPELGPVGLDRGPDLLGQSVDPASAAILRYGDGGGPLAVVSARAPARPSRSP